MKEDCGRVSRLNKLSTKEKDSTTGRRGIKEMYGDWLKHFVDGGPQHVEGMKSHRGLKRKLGHKK